MRKKLEKDNIDQLTSKANEIFEGVEITEEDFIEKFDNHLSKPPQELRSDKEQLLDIGDSCNRYDPCPICFKCRVKGSHLYNKCNDCSINICIHTNSVIERMIKRDHFAINTDEELMDALKELEQKNCSK